MIRQEGVEQDERELAWKFGVYRDVFEQSMLLDHDANKPWNFLISLSAELVVISLALLIPLAYSDHLPPVHWKEIIAVKPPPRPIPVPPTPTRNSTGSSTMLSMAPIQRPIFHWGASSHPAQATTEFTTDAPPTITFQSAGDGLPGPSLGVLITRTPAAPPPQHTATPSGPIRVGGSVQMAKIIRKVMPVYPVLARSARISGVVHLIGIIAKDGTIRNLQLVDGHPLLSPAAIQAVEQWVYKPTLLNGEAVEVIAPIEVNFTLGP
jgi:periplasmic protein TonB